MDRCNECGPQFPLIAVLTHFHCSPLQLWVSSQAGHDGTNTWDPNLVRLVMAQATQHQQVDIDRINFIDAAQWLAAAHDEEPLPVLVINLHHPYHYKPRVRKRRPKQYPWLQTL